MKYSIIVPVYNVEKYINKCLGSIYKQTYDNFEVIIVNDGSTDKSVSIANKYVEKDNRFKLYSKENGGLSSARNYGIQYVTGDYILFIDSDDYIEKELLEEINKKTSVNNEDLVKYQLKKVYKDHEVVNKAVVFNNMNGNEAFVKLINDELFVTAWSTVYNTKFFKKNNFKYAEGRVHEDFGLTPLVYLKAKNVSSISYVGYDYIVRENSIMTSNNEEKQIKRNEDMIYHFKFLVKETNKLDIPEYTKKLANSYYANALINRAKDLTGDTLDKYLKELKELKLYKYLLTNTLPREIKKIIFKVNPKAYINMIKK